jgi:hypothetical protein
VAGFKKHRRSGTAVATFTSAEADLLRALAGQLIELLREDTPTGVSETDPLEAMLDFAGPTTEPEDPVLARLLPTAYPEDEESAADFRRFTESNLRDGKAAASIDLIQSLQEAGLADQPEAGVFIDVELGEELAMSWLKALTDLRLALGTRLGVEEGDEATWASLPDEDPRTQVHDIYDWLGFLQETLIHAIS